jgi:hypothetical protein
VQALLKPVVQTCGKVPVVALVQVAQVMLELMETALRMTVLVARVATDN